MGDRVYRNPESQFFGQCIRCKRHCLSVTKTPEQQHETKPRGFWKVPTE